MKKTFHILMKMIDKRYLVILIGLICSITATAQKKYEKSKVVYFDIDDFSKQVSYSKFDKEPFVLNDSTVLDIRYRKLAKRLIITTYKRNDYYSEGYALPISIMKFKLRKPRLDTVVVEDVITHQVINRIRKNYKTKLIKKIDYSSTVKD